MYFSKEKLPSHNTVYKCAECHGIKLISVVIALFTGITASNIFIDYFHSKSFIRKADVIDSPYYQSLPTKSQNNLKTFLLTDNSTTGKFEKFIRFLDLNQVIQHINDDIRSSHFTNDTQSDDDVTVSKIQE